MFAAVAAFGFAMTSCKKDYVCSCDLGFLGTVETEFNDLNKSDAKDAEEACTASSLCTWKEA